MENKGNKNSRDSSLSKISRDLGAWGILRIHSKLKDKLLYLFPASTNKNKQKQTNKQKQAKYWVSLFRFWRQYIPHLDMLLWCIYQTPKNC